MDLWEFLTVLVLVFSLMMLLAGIFTAYFGSGKSRTIGVVLLVVGLVVGVVWAYLCYWGGPRAIDIPQPLSEVIWDAFTYILAALLGALVAIGVFLLAIMKS
jgi:uncharacterized membrane-anchored protein